MCGLCGVLSTGLNRLEIEAFQDLMVVSTLRGNCGSGIVAVPTSGKRSIEIFKHAYQTAAELVFNGDVVKALNKHNYSLLMGHARQPTKGELTLDHAHPHVLSNIIGMHNGTLSELNGEKLSEKESDSKIFFESMEQYGVEETIKKARGAYAATYINKREETLNFIRNDQRPLYWAQPSSIQTLYWASEADFLRLVLKRVYPSYDIKVFKAQPDVLVSFRIRPTGSVGYFEKKELKQEYTTTTRVANENAAVTTYKTVDGYYVTDQELENTLMGGCVYCNRQADRSDYRNQRTFWTGPNEYVCYDCATHDEFARDYITQNGGGDKLPKRLH